MAELSDIANAIIRDEIEEFLERPDEIERNIALFARVRPAMQDIAAALIEGDNHTVDALTVKALEDGTEALEIMDDGLIAGMGIVGIKFRENFIFVPEVLACARAMKAGMAHIEPILSASRRRAHRHRHHGHGQGRPSRYRQEPLHHDALRRGLRRGRPRRRYLRGRIHRSAGGARGADHGHVGAADDDDAEHGQDHRGADRRGPARRRDGDGGRRTGDAGVRRRHGRRRLRQDALSSWRLPRS